MGDLRQFRTLARNWEALAQADPLFGVLSDPTRIGNKWDVDEFFDSGTAHVRKLLRILDELGVAFSRGHCLDFGCGLGRLTRPLAAGFAHTIGVDVSRSMIAAARRYRNPDDRVEFVRNPHPYLRGFERASFDFVHSSLVLQHIPPEVALRYVAEFFRVAKPGGLVVFQLPAATVSEDALTARYALPEEGYQAQLEIDGLPALVDAGAPTTVAITVTNGSPATWRHDIPAGRHICIANHWRRPDGSMLVPDDGRTRLPERLYPGASVQVPLVVRAPDMPGEYQLEVDLVQERVCWFAERGSQTARATTRVRPASTARAPLPPAPTIATGPTMWERVRHWLRRGNPSFEMHVVPRATIEQVIRDSGGMLLHAIDDNAAGDRWLSFSYVCRKS